MIGRSSDLPNGWHRRLDQWCLVKQGRVVSVVCRVTVDFVKYWMWVVPGGMGRELLLNVAFERAQRALNG